MAEPAVPVAMVAQETRPEHRAETVVPAARLAPSLSPASAVTVATAVLVARASQVPTPPESQVVAVTARTVATAE